MKHRDRSQWVKNSLLMALGLLSAITLVLFVRGALKSWAVSLYCDRSVALPNLDAASSFRKEETSVAATTETSSALEAQEALLLTTFKSCLGKYCMDGEFKDATGVPIIRVGLLAPDNRWVELAAVLKGLHQISDSKDHIELVPTTHVPPYGYGRNHGLSRIIRLVERIPTHASQLLAEPAAPPDAAASPEAYETMIRQLVRWHCRLNHVAAHSAMLTVFINDLRARPVFEVQRMASFIGYKASQEDSAALLAKHPAIGEMLRAVPTAVTLREWQAVAAETIRTELAWSKNLTRWPCKSFKELEAKRVLLPHRRFSLVAANCSAPMVHCSVNYDLREQAAAQTGGVA